MSERTTGLPPLRWLICMLSAWIMSTIAHGQVDSVQGTSPFISEIASAETVSVIKIQGGINHQIGRGMKLLVRGKDASPIAELIVIESHPDQAFAMITEFYTISPLEEGQSVEIKTLNFAAQWK
jgi:hypothetical protein